MWELEGVSLFVVGMSVFCPPALVLRRRNQMTEDMGALGARRPEGRSLSAVLAPSTEGMGGARKWTLQGELWRALGVFAVINQPDRKGVNWWWLFPVC